jgi:glycosyltransferase A (GT-A) superfamily protein (DUF2064 family)
MDAAIVIFGRAPARARPLPGFGRRAAVQADRALLQAAVSAAVRAAGPLATEPGAARSGVSVVLLADGIDEMRGEGLTAPGVRLRAQRGQGFERRLLDGLGGIAAGGVRRLIVAGTDTPDLASADLRAGLDAAPGEAVVGPSPDGGIYLLSLEADRLPLLEGLPWRTDRLGCCLVERLRAAGIRVRCLSPRADVDDAGSARRLRPVLDRLSLDIFGRHLAEGDPVVPAAPEPGAPRPGVLPGPPPGRAPPALAVA